MDLMMENTVTNWHIQILRSLRYLWDISQIFNKHGKEIYALGIQTAHHIKYYR